MCDSFIYYYPRGEVENCRSANDEQTILKLLGIQSVEKCVDKLINSESIILQARQSKK